MQKRILRLESMVRNLDPAKKAHYDGNARADEIEQGHQGKPSRNCVIRVCGSTFWGGPTMPSEDQNLWSLK